MLYRFAAVAVVASVIAVVLAVASGDAVFGVETSRRRSAPTVTRMRHTREVEQSSTSGERTSLQFRRSSALKNYSESADWRAG
jgi:hypothetical protein